MTEMNLDSQTSSILLTIRSSLRSQKITYEQLADSMDLSTASVKRLMLGQVPMSLDRLIKICHIVGLDFYELACLNKYGSRENIPFLTLDQEKVLAENDDLFGIFYLVVMGYSIPHILENFAYTKAELIKSLVQLEKIRILELHADDRLIIKVNRKSRWRKDGPLDKKYMVRMAKEFAGDVYSSKDGLHYFFNLPLTSGSKEIVNQKIKDLFTEVETLSEKDLITHPNLKTSMNVFLASKEWMPSFVKRKVN